MSAVKFYADEVIAERGDSHPDYVRQVRRAERALRDEAYLVKNGVRLLCASTVLFGLWGEADDYRNVVARVARDKGLLPIARHATNPKGEQYLTYGLSKHQWAVDLFYWVEANTDGETHTALRGLLHGYGPHEIGEFLARVRG